MAIEWFKSKIVEESVEVVLVFDGQGQIQYGNQSAISKLGYTEEELLQCNMQEIFRQEFQQDDGSYLPFDLEEMFNKGESALYRKNSSCFLSNIRFYADEAKGLYCLLAEDVSAQKDIDTRIRQLKESQESDRKSRNEFIANITHELRTPVNGIKGHITALMDEVTDDKQRRTMDVILYCCDNMSSIINNILDFSKLEAGKLVLEETEFDFFKMMENVIATHTANVNKKELKLNVYVDENIPRMVIGDELRLNRILNNLLSNAVKFTSVGHINVSVNKTNQINDEIELFFMVKDTGIGISKEEQSRLFQSFSQVDASITRRFGGTGLGLAITKQLVEMMNGSIHVSSEKGKGSDFSFFVKLHTGQNADELQEHVETYNKWSDFSAASQEDEEEEFYNFGSEENLAEIRKRMERLVLSLELEAWDKAETLTETLKSLVQNADGDIKKLVLRLGMAVRKENYDKSMEAYAQVKQALIDRLGEE